ncbi:MAG: hypothetical protein HY289_00525 [Planctomycetes bacterium]|nr:hypothetical protein [Planctomycetota bacterium]
MASQREFAVFADCSDSANYIGNKVGKAEKERHDSAKRVARKIDITVKFLSRLSR